MKSFDQNGNYFHYGSIRRSSNYFAFQKRVKRVFGAVFAQDWNSSVKADSFWIISLLSRCLSDYSRCLPSQRCGLIADFVSAFEVSQYSAFAKDAL